MLWVVGGGLFFLWLILKFLFHQSGYVHLILIGAICLLVVQFAADRRTRYGNSSAGR
jgi:hypothetical protein